MSSQIFRIFRDTYKTVSELHDNVFVAAVYRGDLL